MNIFIYLGTMEEANGYLNRFRNESGPAVYRESRKREMPLPNNSICNDQDMDSSPVHDISSTLNVQTPATFQPTTSNVVSPVEADNADNSGSAIHRADSDEEDEIICSSREDEFMAHSPKVAVQIQYKIDVISTYFGFDTKVKFESNSNCYIHLICIFIFSVKW